MNLLAEFKQLVAEFHKREDEAKALHERIHSLESSVQRVSHSVVLPRTGIDYAFPPHPPLDKLHSAGVSFVGRYLTGAGKALTEQEARDISSHGLDLVVLFETDGRIEGYAKGAHDSRIAMDALNKLKPKGEPPIYFACDFDAQGEGKVNEVLEYIRGAVHTIGWYRVGLYGGHGPIAQAHAEHRCKFLWQTYAWSAGHWFPDAQLRQVRNEIHLFGADCDLDKAMAADFGQFRV